MTRLKYLFAGCLLLLALPIWRYLDMISIVAPFTLPFALSLAVWCCLFLLIPIKLVFPKFKTTFVILLSIFTGGLAAWTQPLSHMATKDSRFNHCGPLTFTGSVYPIRMILTEAYRDDLEARNQLCWVRKMIQRVPERIQGDHEVETYSRLTREKLLSPEIKYKAALPLIAYLFIKINMAGTNYHGAKNIYHALHFWTEHYTEEMSSRNYAWWNWPHSSYIQFEYGLIEKNWQNIVSSLVFE